MEAYAKRTGHAADAYFAVGDAGTILGRIAEYVAAGISKFILRPVGAGDEAMLAQTRQLIEEVLPQVAARWPKGAGSAALRELAPSGSGSRHPRAGAELGRGAEGAEIVGHARLDRGLGHALVPVARFAGERSPVTIGVRPRVAANENDCRQRVASLYL